MSRPSHVISPLPRSCRIPHYAHVFSILSRSGSSEMDDVRREVNEEPGSGRMESGRNGKGLSDEWRTEGET